MEPHLLPLLCALSAPLLGQAGERALPGAGEGAVAELYEDRVQPLLRERCVRCHGPEKQKSRLRVDSLGALLAGGARGPAVLPGDPDGSVLITAVRYGDEDLAMPPKGKLADGEIALLVDWVRAGTPGPRGVDEPEPAPAEPAFDLEARADHWAFRPLAGGPGTTSTTGATGAASRSIDRHIEERLALEGLRPAPEADRRTLLRRLSFDLTGLPPEPAWLDAHLDRPWAECVDELLASPRFGERWARHWLDLVRYAEGRGHEYDHDIPNAYQYRDYVIRAFNADVPYDRFVVEHVAGDLLEEPRLDPETGANESVLGTAFWFLGPEVHSPVDVRADETDRTANKVDVLSRAFLGLTVACARCHDHKFDPISAADFYALSGFALSGGYRQVRFDTIEHNAAVAGELRALEREQEGGLRRRVGAWLEGRALQVEEHLTAASAVAPPAPRADVEDAGAVPQAFLQDVDLLFEDFERSEYAPWTATGTAFGSGPKSRAELADYHNVTGTRGARGVNTHNTEDDEDVVAGDSHVGRLTSPPFTIERGWIHFLICGGEHDTTAVRLELCAEGPEEGEPAFEVVASAHGRNTADLEPAAFDVREWRGRTARLVVVDEHSEGWGNIGLDHVVFSDRSDPSALEVELAPREAAWRAWRIDEEARARGLDPAAVAAWTRDLDAARDDEHDLLHPFAFLAATAPGLAPDVRDRQFDYVFAALASPGESPRAGAVSVSPSPRVLVDYAELPPDEWFQNGFGFVRRAPGELILTEAGLSFASLAGAYWDPTWDVLESAPETEVESEHSLLDWDSAGRMLRTPCTTLEGGRLFYLVRGAGHAFAVVDDHRMVRGPLHTETVLEIDAGGGEGFRWVEHDLSEYAGHRVAIEFSPRRSEGPSEFAVARVVESGVEPGPVVAGEAAEGGTTLALLAGGESTLAGLAGRYEDACRAAARRLRDGEQLEPAQVELLAWLARQARALPELPDAYADRRAELLAEIRPVSRLAPAMLAGSGVDEHVLVRGNARTPGEVVPRRFLEVFDGPAALLHGAAADSDGRLELAQRLVDPELPLLARVWANRVWHHLTGRGIVPTVDDFGHMGEEPSHPLLLDDLARRLIDSGWSTKALVRAIATSDAYRRSSDADPLARERDPERVLLASARRRRLEGEAIRDAILAVSGGLRLDMYGPPVPLHLTDFMQGRGRPEESGPVDGEGRRSVYLAVRRNFTDPFLQVFDFPPRATTIGRRSVSSVPAQALTLLNDPFVVGEARRWAERALAPGTTRERVAAMYLAAFARTPDGFELEAAAHFVEERCRGTADGHYDVEVAEDDPAAWSALAHALFNLEEFIHVD